MIPALARHAIIFVGCLIVVGSGFIVAAIVVEWAINKWVQLARQGEAIFQFLRYRKRFFEWREEHPDAADRYG